MQRGLQAALLLPGEKNGWARKLHGGGVCVLNVPKSRVGLICCLADHDFSLGFFAFFFCFANVGLGCLVPCADAVGTE